MFALFNYKLSDMFQPYRVIIKPYEIMVLDKVHAVCRVETARSVDSCII